jgi:hypothetical protein
MAANLMAANLMAANLMAAKETINVSELFENILKDPKLLTTLDVDSILNTLETDKNDYLEKMTMKTNMETTFEKINNLEIPQEKKEEYCKKLSGYRFVDEINELRKGIHIRWIRFSTGKITNGGLLANIKFLDSGTHIQIINSCKKVIQYKFDECLTFQKLTMEEQLILMAYEYIDNTK